MAGGAASEYSRGGMKTKVEAGKIATAAGTHHGDCARQAAQPAAAHCRRRAGTWFLAEGNPVTARKKWISGHLETRGLVVIDAGAVRALALAARACCRPASARRGPLPARRCHLIQGPAGEEIGRGLVAYDAADAERIAGRNSARSRPFSAMPGAPR